MKIVLCAPFGALFEETGLLYLLGHYLSANSFDVTQLRCNGIFPLCERDVVRGEARDLKTCFQCIGESKRLAEWGRMKSQDLSLFLNGSDLAQSKRLIQSSSIAELRELSIEGVNIYQLCEQSIRSHFGIDPTAQVVKRHEEEIRRVILAGYRAGIAMQKAGAALAGDLCFSTRPNDFITRSFLEGSQRRGVAQYSFSWVASRRVVTIEERGTDRKLESPLIFDDVISMRTEISTWPTEIISQLQSIMMFVGITDSQLSLPLAR